MGRQSYNYIDVYELVRFGKPPRVLTFSWKDGILLGARLLWTVLQYRLFYYYPELGVTRELNLFVQWTWLLQLIYWTLLLVASGVSTILRSDAVWSTLVFHATLTVHAGVWATLIAVPLVGTSPSAMFRASKATEGYVFFTRFGNITLLVLPCIMWHVLLLPELTPLIRVFRRKMLTSLQSNRQRLLCLVYQLTMPVLAIVLWNVAFNPKTPGMSDIPRFGVLGSLVFLVVAAGSAAVFLFLIALIASRRAAADDDSILTRLFHVGSDGKFYVDIPDDLEIGSEHEAEILATALSGVLTGLLAELSEKSGLKFVGKPDEPQASAPAASAAAAREASTPQEARQAFAAAARTRAGPAGARVTRRRPRKQR